jgi:hypothetical protein
MGADEEDGPEEEGGEGDFQTSIETGRSIEELNGAASLGN